MSNKATLASLEELQAYLDSDFIPPQPTASEQQPPIHLFTDLDWESVEEPPYPLNSRHPELYNLLTVTGLVLIGYYPHDTHELNQPDSHYIAWAPLQASAAPKHLH